MINVYIDGDWILYAAGFAGQKNKYVVPGVFGEQEFDTLTALRVATDLSDKDMEKGAPVYSRIVLDPDSHFFHSASSMIRKNVDLIEHKFNDQANVIVLMDGDGNFRQRIATIKPYKGNRSGAAKPLKYMDIKKFLIDNYETVIVHGQETDDEMAIRQTADFLAGQKSIIVSVDKDMLQVPGWHRNPDKGFMRISERGGLRRLYVQCIAGDATDNIGGAYKVGPVKAAAALGDCTIAAQMWNATVATYQETIDKHGNHYGGLHSYSAAAENMQLVYLRRTPGETWMPPEVD